MKKQIKNKTKTGALSKSAGFPGTDQINKSWMQTQEDLFMERIRQETEEFFARTSPLREIMQDENVVSLTLSGAKPFTLENITKEEFINAVALIREGMSLENKTVRAPLVVRKGIVKSKTQTMKNSKSRSGR